MATKLHVVPFRRKRAGITDYRRRLGLLKSGKPRLVIRKSLNHMLVQFVEYAEGGDSVIVAVKSDALRKLGFRASTGNLPAAYLTGLLAGTRAKQKGVKEAIIDIGLQKSTKGSRVYAAAKGVVDSGISVPCSGEVLPKQDRIEGRHIEAYAKALKPDTARFNRQFSAYIKNDIDVAAFSKMFSEVKKRIVAK